MSAGRIAGALLVVLAIEGAALALFLASQAAHSTPLHVAAWAVLGMGTVLFAGALAWHGPCAGFVERRSSRPSRPAALEVQR